MKEHGSFELIGETRDDATGEAYDKVARVLNLPYPGGPHIDRLAHEEGEAVPFPRVWLEEDSYDFSFSGLKSAVINYKHNMDQRGEAISPAAVAKGFQESVVEVLTAKTLRLCSRISGETGYCGWRCSKIRGCEFLWRLYLKRKVSRFCTAA